MIANAPLKENLENKVHTSARCAASATLSGHAGPHEGEKRHHPSVRQRLEKLTGAWETRLRWQVTTEEDWKFPEKEMKITEVYARAGVTE